MAAWRGWANTRSPSRTRASERRSAPMSACRRSERETAWRGMSSGASSTATSTPSGASAAPISAPWWPSSRSTLENMPTPSRVSASRFRSVWETIVPSTTGSVSRARPRRRATISAREGSPRRAGSVVDMSTPMNVPCIASLRLARRHVGAHARIACQAMARANIDAHITPRPASDQAGLGGEQTRCDAVHADVREREQCEHEAEDAGDDEAHAAQQAWHACTGYAPRARPRGDERRLQAGQAFGGDARQQVRRREAVAHRGAPQARDGRADGSRALVAVEHLRGDAAARRSARRARARRRPCVFAAARRAPGGAATRRARARPPVARAGRRGRRAARRGSRGCRMRRRVWRRRTPL